MAYVYALDDNKLVLKAEELVRKTGVYGWVKLRFLVRCSIEYVGATITSSRLMLGLCEGSGGGYLSASTPGYIGASSGTQSLSYSAGFYQTTTNQLVITQKSGAGPAVDSIYSHSYQTHLAYPGTSLAGVEFTKQGGSTLFIRNYAAGPGAPVSYDRSAFIRYATQEVTAAPGYGRVYSATVTYTGNQIEALDTVSLYWRPSSSALFVSDMILVVFT